MPLGILKILETSCKSKSSPILGSFKKKKESYSEHKKTIGKF